MTLKRKRVFISLAICLILQFSGSCFLWETQESSTKDKETNQPERSKEDDNKKDERKRRELEEELQLLKKDLRKQVVKIKGFEGYKIGPITSNLVSKACDKRSHESCSIIQQKTEKLIVQVNKYCRGFPSKCKEKLQKREKKEVVFQINAFCNPYDYEEVYFDKGGKPQQSTAYKKFDQCETLKTTVTEENLNRLITQKKESSIKEGANSSTSKTKGSEGDRVDVNPPDYLLMALYILGGVVSMGGIAGFGWLSYSLFSKSKDEKVQERRLTKKGFDDVGTQNHKLKQRIAELEKSAKVKDGQYLQIQSQLKVLERRISQVSNQAADGQKVAPPKPYQPEPQFPVSVEDYRKKNGNNIQQEATADPIAGILTSDLSEGSEFVIVKGSELGNGLYYAIPNQDRFASKSEYSNFQKYYDFDNPSGGTLWIREPAIVKHIGGGWKLYGKGKLEVR